MRARIRLSAAVVALALAAIACGGGGDSGSGDGSIGSAIEVSGREFVFTPDEFTVPAGTATEVAFENAGTVEHNWVVLAEPIRAEGDLTEDNIIFTLAAAPGLTARDTFQPPPSGTYQVICDIPGHLAAGMEGELTVTASP